MLKPIQDYTLLSDRVYEAIKTAIRNGTFQPEEKVTETKLATALGVSRTPVREALRLLHSEGYVRLTPNSNFVISSLTENDIRESLQVRIALETEAVRLAVEKIDDEKARALQACFDTILEVNHEVDSEEEAIKFYEADRAFHNKIVEITGNSQLMQIYGSLGDRVYRVRIALATLPGAVSISTRHHREIITAIINRDADQAAKLMRAHLNYIATTVLPLSF